MTVTYYSLEYPEYERRMRFIRLKVRFYLMYPEKLTLTLEPRHD